jgi:iron(II)-dependent oxidoreductase
MIRIRMARALVKKPPFVPMMPARRGTAIFHAAHRDDRSPRESCPMPEEMSPVAAELAAWLRDARARTLALVAGLTDQQLMGPRLPIVNPMRWETGHVAWFQNYWVLRHARREPPVREDEDALYDSFKAAHDTRWNLPLPSWAETLQYAQAVLDRALAVLGERQPTPDEVYFHRLAVFHEDMHGEAFTYTRQTLGYPRPPLGGSPAQDVERGAGPLPGDARVPGGRFMLGATPDLPFVFDNEKWAHPVEVAPFAIARAAVTNSEFAAFVDGGGYRKQELWTPEGWSWRQSAGAEHPVYWCREPGGGWLRRSYDLWLAIEPHHPVIHVNWYEADAFCRWAGRRLPTEAEWELAAAAEPDVAANGVTARRRRYPWGDDPPVAERANLDGGAGGCVDVGALAAGDSAFGCRQMLGNVWEWTATAFAPYPGFVLDPYKEYSAPWFDGRHMVLRGGCWATRARLLRNTWRNFYPPDRRDVFAGFRTCAV